VVQIKTADAQAPPSPRTAGSVWAPVLDGFSAWWTAPGDTEIDALRQWRTTADEAKATALVRIIRFGRQHRFQTDVNAGRVEGTQRRLSDLCAAFGVTERHGRNARDIWDEVASRGLRIPEEWWGLGSGSVHDLVKGRAPRAARVRALAKADQSEPFEALLKRVSRAVDTHVPGRGPARRRALERLAQWVRDELGALCSDDVLEVVDKEDWQAVERIRSLGEDDLDALVDRQHLMLDKVWVAYAAVKEPIEPRTLVSRIYGSSPIAHPARPTRAIREKLDLLCVERRKVGRRVLFLPLDPDAHREQVRFRRMRATNDQRVAASLEALKGRIGGSIEAINEAA